VLNYFASGGQRTVVGRAKNWPRLIRWVGLLAGKYGM